MLVLAQDHGVHGGRNWLDGWAFGDLLPYLYRGRDKDGFISQRGRKNLPRINDTVYFWVGDVGEEMKGYRRRTR